MKKGRKPNEIIEIPEIYDSDRFDGTSFSKTLPAILNKRYADGWKFIQLYSQGVNEYGILYKRIEATKGVELNGKTPTFELAE